MREHFTPLEIQMMLHYYAIAEPYACREPLHAGSRAVSEQRGRLLRLGMLEAADMDEWPSGYRVTEKGLVYVKALQSVSEPTARWECTFGES